MPAHRSARRATYSQPKYTYFSDEDEDEDEAPSSHAECNPLPAPPPCALALTTPPKGPSHARKQSPSHIPRPRNAFIIFRSEFCQRQKMSESGIESNHRHISRIAAHVWNNLDGDSKAAYKARAEAEKKAHMITHPTYRYAPAGRPKSTRKVPNGKVEELRCRKVAELLLSGVVGEALQKAAKELDQGVAEVQLTERTSQPASRRPRHPRRRPAPLPVVQREVSVEVDIKEEEESPILGLLSSLPEELSYDAPYASKDSLAAPHWNAENLDLAPPLTPYSYPRGDFLPSLVQLAPHPHLRPGAASNFTLAELYSRDPALGPLHEPQDSPRVHWRESAPSPPALPPSPSPSPVFTKARKVTELSLCYPEDASESEIEIEFDNYLTGI